MSSSKVFLYPISHPQIKGKSPPAFRIFKAILGNNQQENKTLGVQFSKELSCAPSSSTKILFAYAPPTP